VPTLTRLTDSARGAVALARTGVLRPERPDRLWDMARSVRHWGVTLAAAYSLAGARYGDRIAIADERGSESFAELDHRTEAIARGLIETGVHADDTVAVLCRNHRYILETAGALAKLGAHAVYLNTGFSGPQLRAVMHKERAILLVHDEEFVDVAHDAGVEPRVLAWTDDDGDRPRPDGTRSLNELAARHAAGPAPTRPVHEGRTVILTSGTTGAPKGAIPARAVDPRAGVALLERIPYRARETMVIAAPCFHSWGMTNAMLGLLFGNTMVLERHFDAERTLAAIASSHAQVLTAVPVMARRIVDLPAEVRTQYDTSSLRVVALSGSALDGDLAPRFMDAFGDLLYNLYGSTEVGAVAVATPADLRVAPATAGYPPRGTEIRLLDADDHVVAPGEIGRIFVRGPLLFKGYTDGNVKIIVDGFMHTGDTGHIDAAGRLFVDGRDDDMIVSGGENVFPREVEDVISAHPAVVEAAVVGVSDPEFGQRLKAFVVVSPGTAIDADAVRDHVRDNLARFKVPRDVEFVDALPRNATGKVVRRALGNEAAEA